MLFMCFGKGIQGDDIWPNLRLQERFSGRGDMPCVNLPLKSQWELLDSKHY